jgi:catechol 2,3-dioxygenase-like lactoylglutathione lyase family enzyme
VIVAAMVVVALGAWALSSRATTEPRPAALVRGVESVAISVSSADRALDFYTQVLRFQKVTDAEVAGGAPEARARVVRLRLGEEALDLIEFRSPRGRPVPADSRSHDRWFQHVAIVVNDMDQAYAWLRRHRVTPISPEPQRLPDWNIAAAGIRAFYFKDGDGHPLEIIQFPPDKGQPRWQRPSPSIFLGIDHTAIAVDDTEVSLAFYRDTLGLRVVGESENHGPEQERLNAVRGAHLRITTLRAEHGPGIELLQYRSPHDGRPLPRDAHPSDLVAWQVRLTLGNVADVRAALRERATWLSPAATTSGQPALGFAQTLLARDPDGHLLALGTRR